MKKLLFGFLILTSCVKKDAIIQPDPKDRAVIYNYNLDILTSKDDSSGATEDTLIIKINGAIKVFGTGATIPKYIKDLKISTGDQLYIYHNPGRTDLYMNGVKWQENQPLYTTLECYFTGGYKNPQVKFMSKGPQSYNGIIKE